MAKQNFNPRTREGCDREMILGGRVVFLFQSTHPRGVRLTGLAAGNRGGIISIHAPARGATVANNAVKTYLRISIHAPARGATM